MKLQVGGLLLLSTVLGIAAQLCLKYAMSHYEFDFSNVARVAVSLLTNLYVWAWFILSVVGNIAWMLVLREMQVNLAFPIAQSFGFVLLIAGAFFLFNEKLSLLQLGGIGVILVGIVMTLVR